MEEEASSGKRELVAGCASMARASTPQCICASTAATTAHICAAWLRASPCVPDNAPQWRRVSGRAPIVRSVGVGSHARKWPQAPIGASQTRHTFSQT